MEKVTEPLITLLTDFGLDDHYVAAMKGVLLQLCPDAVLVDICHTIKRHSIAEGAYILSQVAPYFPKGAVHLAVVDPGVGTSRRRLAVQARRSYYVGPDNGLLIPAAHGEGIVKVVEITKRELMYKTLSPTFEGRDVFAPIAAYLARGTDIEQLGPEILDPIELSWGSLKELSSGIAGEVLHIDRFGNLITNIPASSVATWRLQTSLHIKIGAKSNKAVLCESYNYVPVGGLALLMGSGGFVEVSVNRGSAQALFNAEVGFTVEVGQRPIRKGGMGR